MLIQAHLILLQLSLRALRVPQSKLARQSPLAPLYERGVGGDFERLPLGRELKAERLRRPAKRGTPRNDTLVIASVLVKRCYPSAHVVGDKDDQAHNGHVLKDHPVNFHTL